MIESLVVLPKRKPLPVTLARGSIREAPYTKASIVDVANLAHINLELNTPLRAILHRHGITNSADLTLQINTYLKAHQSGTVSGNLLFSKKQDTLIRQALVARCDITTNRLVYNPMRRRSGRGPRYVSRPTKLSVGGLTKIAHQLSVAYSFVALKLCSAFQVPVDSSLTPILLFLLFGKITPGLPSKLKAIAGKEVPSPKGGAVGDGAISPALAKIGILDLTPQLIKKYGHTLVDRIPALYLQYKKEILATKLSAFKKPAPGVHSRHGYVYKQKVKNARQAHNEKAHIQISQELEALDPEIKAFVRLFVPEILYADPEYKRLEREVRSASSGAWRAESKVRALKRDLAHGRLKTALQKARLANAIQDLKRIKDRINDAKKLLNAYIDQGGVRPWMIPYLPSKVRDSLTPEKLGTDTANVKISKKLLIQQLVNKANAGKLNPGAPELQVRIDPATSQLLTMGGISNIIDDCLGGDSVLAFKTVFARCRATLKPKVFATALLEGGKAQGLKTDIGTVRNKRLLRLNKFKSTDIDSIIKQYRTTIEGWKTTLTQVKDIAVGVQKEAKVETKYRVTPVGASTLAQWNAEAQSYVLGIHGVGVSIVKGWVVHRPPAMQALLQNLKGSTTVKVIPHCFHGTAKQTGAVILTYGFKISGTQVTARSMGDVLYLAPNMDKSAQYLNTSGGFTHKDGQTGIIFMGDVLISGSPRGSGQGRPGGPRPTKASGFRWTKTGNYRTEEIGVGNPNKQYIIRRVFLVKITRTGVRGNGKVHTGVGKFSSAIDFDKWFAQVPE